MIVCEDGIYREATPEEIAEHDAITQLAIQMATDFDYQAALSELGVNV